MTEKAGKTITRAHAMLGDYIPHNLHELIQELG